MWFSRYVSGHTNRQTNKQTYLSQYFVSSGMQTKNRNKLIVISC